MERSTAIVLIVAIIFGSLLVALWATNAHQDNNREKALIETCIQSGGSPDIGERSGSLRECRR